MAAGRCALYGCAMTTQAVPMTVLRALWSARSWRALLHVLTGAPAGFAAGLLVLGLPVLVWYGAFHTVPVASRSIGDATSAVTLTALAVITPVTLLWCVQALSAVQRGRFRVVLGTDIPAPSRAELGSRLWLEGRWLQWLMVEWRDPATWRQLAYHLLSLVTGIAGAVLVVAALAPALAAVVMVARGDSGLGMIVLALAGVLAAPWVARGVAFADEQAGRALLGPSRTEALTERVETLARSRSDIIAATDAERRRIERDLHDGAQQRLVSLAMKLGMARADLDGVPEPARLAIEQAHDEAVQALAELRDLVRGLHPAVIDDRGLDAALSGIAARSPVPVRLRVDAGRRCSPTIEAVAYFVVSEALANVAKHAEATRADVTVSLSGDRLRVAVTDDGRGGAVFGAGTGLRGLAQRAAAVDGTMTVDSPVGGPTTITVELPCES